MPTFLNRGATFLGRNLQAAGGREVVYRRKTSSVAITITPLALQENVEVTENVGVEVDKFDWTVTASELVINGETTLPQQGDIISETLGGHAYEYRVSKGGKDKQYWEWLDQGTRTLLRVHTTKVTGP